MKLKLLAVLTVVMTTLFFVPSSFAEITGIYINSDTVVNTDKMNYLIKNAKAVGIKTFVVDYDLNTPKYAKNIQLIKQNGIKYVARVVIFPGGATPDQVNSKPYLEKRLAQIKEAISLGADEIQLDYIRFKPTQKPSEENARKIAEVIHYFSDYVSKQGLPLQVDVFGISSYKPSIYIGQDDKLIAAHVSSINPMVYPSHYVPYQEHAHIPYQTIHSSLVSLKKQLQDNPNVKVVAYIEIFNFRHKMSDEQRTKYILAEMKAVKDGGANGWYVWSAGNHYSFLFTLLQQLQSGKLSLDKAELTNPLNN